MTIIKIIFVDVDKAMARIDSVVFIEMENILSQIYNWFHEISAKGTFWKRIKIVLI